MEINNVEVFVEYFEKVRMRTIRVAKLIPEENLEWTYKEGKFTFGDLLRHLATIERFMYAENAQFKPSKYPGCGRDIADGLPNVFTFMDNCHRESMEIFSKLTLHDLFKKCVTPAGIEITLWKWLRAMIEHEVHHRGQIYLYLEMIGVKTPPLYGLTSEEVQEKSRMK